jgi:hypothetical protein
LIDELAGIVGVNPEPFTLRELCNMAQGRNRAEWSRTAYIAATIINSNPFRKSTRPVQPCELNPYAQQEQQDKKPDYYISVKTLANAFIKKQ